MRLREVRTVAVAREKLHATRDQLLETPLCTHNQSAHVRARVQEELWRLRLDEMEQRLVSRDVGRKLVGTETENEVDANVLRSKRQDRGL